MNRQSTILIIVVSVIVGIIYFIPNVLMIIRSPDRVHLPFSFAETLYAAQVSELLEGHLGIGDPQLFEHKFTFPSVFPYIPIVVLGITSFISGSVVNGFYLSDFLFPALLCFLLITFIRSLTRRIDVAIAVSLLVLFIYPFILRFPPLAVSGFSQFFKELLLIDIRDRLSFYRTPNPQISLIFLTLALWSLWKFWEKNERKILILAIITGAALYSVYFYHAVYFLFIVVTLWITALFQRQYIILRKISLLVAVLSAIGISYFMVMKNPAYRDLAVTGGKFYARYFDWLYTVRYGLMAIGVWIFLRLVPQKMFFFLLSLPVAGILSMNMQLFTGWTVQPGHFPQTTVEPFITMLVGVIVIYQFKLWEKRNTLALVSLTIILYAILTQSLQAERYRNTWAITHDLARVLDWLKNNTSKATVVVSLDPGVLAYIPVMTPANIFLPVEEYHYASIEEIWQRVLYAYKIYSVPPENFKPEEAGISILFEQTYNINQFKHTDINEYSPRVQLALQTCYPSLCAGQYALPISVSRQMKNEYNQADSEAISFRVNYAVYSPIERSLNGSPPDGMLVFQAGEYEIYQLN